MPDIRTIRSIGIEGERKIYFFSYEEGPPPDGHFRIDTLYTGVSAGTELTFLRGSNPYLHSRWDDQAGVFVSGEPSIRYPVPFMGYMEVGRVSESRTPYVREGDIVSMTYGHKTGHTAHGSHEFFMPLPSDLDSLLGIYVAQMGPICANGLLHAGADLVGANVRDLGDGVCGRNVLVMGAGVVALLTGLFARFYGAANVVLAYHAADRLAVADKLGLTPLDTRAQEPWQYCKEHWHHGPGDRGADLVFQCRGRSEALHMALRSLRPQGTVIDMAFYQAGASQLYLGEEFHHNGLSIQCAQIGRVPRGLGFAWNRQRLALETLKLLHAYGSQIQQHMITDVVPFDNAPELMSRLSGSQHQIIQAVFKVAA